MDHPRKKAVGTTANTSQPTQNRRTVVGLEAFANRRGVGKAIAKFRERKQRKRQKTAQALRQYAKVMKEAGYEAGKGASRKRKAATYTSVDASGRMTKEREEPSPTVDDHDDDDPEGVPDAPPAHSHSTHAQTKHQRKRHKKTNPYKDLQQQHEKVKAKNVVVDKETQEKIRHQKLRQRRQRTQKLRQTTRRGQPVMRQRVALILEKLEKEKSEGA